MTTMSAALSNSSGLDEGGPSVTGTERAASEDASIANLVDSEISAFSQVDSFD